ncbi:MAG: hypothetical protein IVW57_03240 [Ktedonobacterales bacterium]|nr:hypothetical protein [Ktedonobacterales bacterium]
MPQPLPGATTSRSRLSQFALLLHMRKTGMLVMAVLRDARVHPFRKLAFVGSLGVLLAAVLVPEIFTDVATFLVPVLGLFGVPLEIGGEIGVDWLIFGVAAFNLLRLFPADIVGEHYDRLFRSKRR